MNSRPGITLSAEAKKILEKVDAVPTFPESVAKLSLLLGDERSGASDFEQVIKPDPGMTANLLRAVNSAYFGLGREIASVRQAVTVIGTRRLFEIVASSSFSKIIPDQIPGYDIDARAFWLHCVAVAVLGERVAGEISQRAPEMTFTAGLLHDVGKIVIGTFLDESAERVMSRMEDEGLAFVSAEREVLMTDHTEIGAELADRWHLPQGVLNAARYHHTPNDVPDDVDQTLVDVIHIADGLAHTIGFGADIGGLKRRMEPEAIERLKLDADVLDRVTSIALDEIHAVAEALNPDR